MADCFSHNSSKPLVTAMYIHIVVTFSLGLVNPELDLEFKGSEVS